MNLALFDFDGTITASDTFTPFLRLAATPGRMLAGSVLLGPLALGYRLGAVSASRVRPVVARVAFRGASAADVCDLGRKYATDVLPGTVRQRAHERVARHQEQGDDVVVVSASLDVYLRPWCESRGLGCLCTELEELNGRLTGRYRHGDCSGAEKVRQIRKHYPLERYAQVYAYGDTSEDREMLALAHRKFFRWQEIADWSEAMDHGHPTAARPARG